MPTLIVVDGFEAAITWAINSSGGGGLATTVANPSAFTHDTGIKRSGSYSLKCVQDGVNASRISKTITGTRMLVGSFYFYSAAAPGTASVFFDGASGPRPQFRINTDGTISALFNGGTAQTKTGSVCDSTWHRIDFRADTSVTNAFTLDWQVDAVAQTQATRALTAADNTTFQIGTAGTAPNLTFYVDDLVMSATSGDYPIGEHSVFAIKPSSDGTHNAGTNTIEDNAGNDIHSVNFPANPLVDNWPPDTSVYVRQATADTTAYAEVNFANVDASMTTFWDAQALVAFTASASTANEGATIVSYDGFSTSTEVYGTPSARTNYTTSTTTALNYKVSNTSTVQGVITRPGGGWTSTELNALQARIGYSNDVTGNPRWHGLIVQYAGTVSGGGGGGGGDADSLGDLLI